MVREGLTREVVVGARRKAAISPLLLQRQRIWRRVLSGVGGGEQEERGRRDARTPGGKQSPRHARRAPARTRRACRFR